jgi:tetratricopeptide (TPR) repeat protein
VVVVTVHAVVGDIMSEAPDAAATAASTERDQMIAKLWNRLRRFRASVDPAFVTGPDTAQEIAWAQGLTPRGEDVQAVAPAIAVAWLRYLIMPAGRDDGDRAALAWAVGLALPVYPASPESMPSYLRALCAEIISLPSEKELLNVIASWHTAHDPNKEVMLAEAVAQLLESEPELQPHGYASLAELLRIPPTLKRLQVAIVVMRWSIEATAPGDPDHAERLNRMSRLLRLKWDLTGEPADLDDAIAKLREAIELTAADAIKCAAYRSSLSGQLQLRYENADREEDLAEALELAREATEVVTGRAGFEHNYAGALGLEYERTTDPADLDAAIAREYLALRCAPPGTDGRAEILSVIGVNLRARHNRTLERTDLDESIRAQRAAIDETPAHDQVGRAIRLGNLATVVSQRYSETEEESDLADMIGLSAEALNLLPEHHPQRGLFLSNYAGALRARYDRSDEDLADLTSAIDLMAAAVIATPDQHPGKPMYLANLAAGYQTKYRKTRDRADLTEALVAADLAVQAAERLTLPERLAEAYAVRGSAYSTAYERTNDTDILDAAVHDCVQAVQLTPQQSSRFGSYIANLASIQLSHAARTRNEGDRVAALAALRTAAALTTTPTSTRIAAARAAAGLCASSGDWNEASDLLLQAVRLLPLTVPRELQLADQENWLGKFGDLAADAAACAIEADKLDDAVAALEFGRGILLGQAIQLRSAIADLRAAHPSQADRFEQLRTELDAPVADGPLTAPSADGALAVFDADRARTNRRNELAAELKVLAEEIRQLPGFADFLQPPSVANLTAATASGPVVFINVSSFRSDALILRADGVTPVQLTSLTHDAVENNARALMSAIRMSATADNKTFSQAQDAVGQILGWLWEAIAEPVLTKLGYTATPEPGQSAPRVWWAPVGMLSYLPLHAAGLSGNGMATVLDRVVSSYTPTVYALADSRKRQHAPTATDTMLVVAMPTTPGASDLDGAGLEAELLTTRFPAAQVLGSWSRADRPATNGSVIAALAVHAYAHFACHADCDLDLPSRSVLRLSDHQTDPLTIADIARLSLSHVQLAYLSACETAMTAARLTDEALHLVTAFSLAGYPHVIGTLWKVDDSAAFSIARRVYEQLAPAGGSQPHPALTARALHAAVHHMRDRFTGMPTLWAAHIHSGA